MRIAISFAWLVACVTTRPSSAFIPQYRSPRPVLTVSPFQSQGFKARQVAATTTTLNVAASMDMKDKNNDVVETKNTMWPCGDALDARLMKIAIPMIMSFMITPLMGAIDLFWVNRMGNALAVAGQAASNQVYNTAFWLASFLPSVTATLVAKEFAKGDQEAVQDSVCQALFVGILIACIATPLLFLRPQGALLSVLKGNAPAMAYAKPYIMIRALSFLPGIINLVGFSAFRGTQDMMTPVKITMMTNLLNAVADPICIFALAMGVPGAALATLAAEVLASFTYLTLLVKKNFISFKKVFKLPSWKRLEPLVRGGFAMQLRLIAMNITFLAVARVTQGMDPTGVAAAAHAMALQTFQIGGVVLMALSTVAQSLIPADLVEKKDPKTGKIEGGPIVARKTSNRMMGWGLVAGTALGAMQIAMLPVIFKTTPMMEVRNAATMPAIVASVLQAINGVVFIGEGVMVGCGNFMQLAASTIVATAGCVASLNYLPKTYGLTGVWMGFGVFNLLRLIGVWIHQYKTSPIAPEKIRQAEFKKRHASNENWRAKYGL